MVLYTYKGKRKINQQTNIYFKREDLIMEYKIVHTDKETGAKVSVIYQDNGWICEVWEHPDGTREEMYHK